MRYTPDSSSKDLALLRRVPWWQGAQRRGTSTPRADGGPRQLHERRQPEMQPSPVSALARVATTSVSPWRGAQGGDPTATCVATSGG